jgi:hypothetical protein
LQIITQLRVRPIADADAANQRHKHLAHDMAPRLAAVNEFGRSDLREYRPSVRL